MKATFFPKIRCPYCREQQYQTMKSKVINSILVGSVILLYALILVFIDIPIAIAITLMFSLIVNYLLLYPFLVVVKSKNNI